MKKWIFVGLILLLSINNISADVSYHYDTDGYGTFTYSGTAYEDSGDWYTGYLHYYGTTLTQDTVHVQYYATFPTLNPTDYYRTLNSVGTHPDSQIWYSGDVNDNQSIMMGKHVYDAGAYEFSMTIIASPSDLTEYTIIGNISCVDWARLYIYTNEGYTLFDSKDGTGDYSFKILDTQQYKLNFSNGYEYEFTCNGNTTYDYDACNYCTITINDECANLLYNQFTWIDDDGTIVYEGRDNPITFMAGSVNKDDKLTVMWTTWLGALQKTCYAQFDHPINLYDPFIYWDMEINVYDNESNPIYGANVDFNQDCVINGYPTRNKYTDSGGMATFTQCENDNANLIVSKDGYKTLSTSVSGGWYDVYTPTYQVSVMLQSADSDDSSTWDLINDSINDTNANETPNDIPDVNGTPNDIHIYFKDINGDYTSQINDTDDYVRCYYSVHSPDDVDMTLVFQKSFTGYYFYDIDTYNYSIDNNSYGYFEIPNSYFNDSTYSYRAYIYDLSYPYDDRYAYLNVVNQSEPYYENLTGYCMFMHTNKNGSIDYREDIICYAIVISDNASLRMVSLELYDNSTLIDYVNLTDSSFDEDDIYGWYLGYNYTLGHNYSLVLKGYDGSILDCDNVIAYNLVGNKLTIKVTDSFNHPLSNVYVFCEHYGSINTGWLNYGTFEGLPNGETRYKASKSGYRSGLWSTVNLTDENEIVSYQLIQEKQEGSTAMVRLSDDDAKNLYYPLMYFLLTLILLGALINVIK